MQLDKLTTESVLDTLTFHPRDRALSGGAPGSLSSCSFGAKKVSSRVAVVVRFGCHEGSGGQERLLSITRAPDAPGGGPGELA